MLGDDVAVAGPVVLGADVEGYQQVWSSAPGAVCSAIAWRLATARLWVLRWSLAQAAQRVCPGTAGLPHPTQSPSAIRFLRFSAVRRRLASLRSGCWSLARSYCRRSPIVALLVLGFLLAGLSFVVDCGPWPGFGVVCLVGWLGAWTFRCVLGGLFGDVL